MNVLTRAGRKRAGLDPPSPCQIQPTQPRLQLPSSETLKGGRPIKGKEPIRVQQASKSPLTDSDSNATWVQCDKCKKWRKLHKNKSSPSTPPDTQGEWYCHMNTSPHHNMCESSEEAWQVLPRGLIYTYKGLTPGQLVWGKMVSYPPWPAIVTPDPFTDNNHIEEVGGVESGCGAGCIYHVEFLGRQRTHLWLPEEMVEPYRNGSCSIGCITTGRGDTIPVKLRDAISEANSLQDLSNAERLEKCHYITEKVIGTPLVKEEVKKKKRISSTNKAIGHHKTDHPSSPTTEYVAVSKKPDLINNPELMMPVVMKTGLQILQMLGINVSADDLKKNIGNHGNSAPPIGNSEPLSSALSQLMETNRKATATKKAESTNKSSTHKRSKTISNRGRGGKRGRVPKSSTHNHTNSRPHPPPSSSCIERYFKSNKPTAKTNESSEEPLATSTNQMLDQVVPEIVSLDHLTQEAMNDLTDIENLLDHLDHDQHRQLSQDSITNTTTTTDEGVNHSSPPPHHDHDIQSLLIQLQELENTINTTTST